MSSFVQTSNVFEYPQLAPNFQAMMYAQQAQAMLYAQSPPPSQSPSYQMQWCDFVYTPVQTPNGVTLTPSLVPVSPSNSQFFGNPVPSPMSSSQSSYVPAPALQNANNVKGNERRRSNSLVINGIPVEEWKAMSDFEREEFLKVKRRQEAYRTALCKAFKNSGGECKYGNECRFAHGEQELRLPKNNHPKYKTVLCRTYAVVGVCPYGSRCQFIHEKYAGPIPDEYVLSVENIRPVKQIYTNKKPHKSVQFSGCKDNLSHFRDDKNYTEVRRAKKERLANNEDNYLSDLGESFDKMFDTNKFSRSCKPRIGQ